jgi:hypothetical protein
MANSELTTVPWLSLEGLHGRGLTRLTFTLRTDAVHPKPSHAGGAAQVEPGGGGHVHTFALHLGHLVDAFIQSDLQ